MGWLTQHPETDQYGHTNGELRVMDYIYLWHAGFEREMIMTNCNMTVRELKAEISMHLRLRYEYDAPVSTMSLCFREASIYDDQDLYFRSAGNILDDDGKTLFELRVFEAANIEMETIYVPV